MDNSVTTCPRSRFHEAASWCAQRVAVGLNLLARKPLGKGFGILMYHRVAERTPGVETPTVNVTPARLREQLQGLLKKGFVPWSLRKAIEHHQQSRPIPTNVFVVTFDDGYANNLLYALPILEELRVPATIFLATAYLDSDRPFPFENWSMAGSARVPTASWRPLTTAECHELQASEFIELGAHTHTHDAFAGKADEFRRDLAISIGILQSRFGVAEPTFSFPFGLTTPEMHAVARKSGVCCALNTQPERVTPESNPFLWGRFCACDLDTASTLATKLNGWYTPVANVLRAMKRPMASITPRVTGELMPHPKPCFAAGKRKTR
jgi:peptidoglycan/xylan/chitin deacetylase (PgdA/CDA1 family)